MESQLPAYTVTRKRMRYTRIKVKPPHGEVVVSAPYGVADKDIEAFVASRVQWIHQHRQRLATLPAPLEAGPETERLRRQLRRDVPPLVQYWAQRMGLEMPHITYRRMTTRWGSCNPRLNRITLSIELARRDPELLEYVIVHELAHMLELSHNHRFYAVMDKYLPDWKAKRRQLNGRR